jgi:hypothetical protein
MQRNPWRRSLQNHRQAAEQQKFQSLESMFSIQYTGIVNGL